jgi:glycyl-tRNA synthetase
MSEKKLTIEQLATFCKQKGFVFQAGEIYGGLAGFFDFGPLGVELKNNLKQKYWKDFVHKREDIVGQDGAIITNPKVWKASGHVDGFADLILTTKETKTKLRADHFIEETLNIPGDSLTAEDINALVKEHKLTYNGEEFEEVKDFNLMFSTQVGASVTKNSTAYLRPETAQSIFPNFRLIQETSRKQLPFGITQIGKAYRNEISPRDFVFRCREFEQIEMEYFFHPETSCSLLSEKELQTTVLFLSAEAQEKDSTEMVEITIKELLDQGKLIDYHAYWLATFYNWFVESLGFNNKHLRIREHTKTELSHYSKATMDIDYLYPMGYKEMFGLANRGNFDLSQHQQYSKTKMEIFDEATKSKIIPHVIEPSLGLERFMMAVLYEAYREDESRGNIVLSLPPILSPIQVGVFPLMNKEELTLKAREIFNDLLDQDIKVIYDKSGSVGKRYARSDEIGIPFCVTIDYESIEDGELKDTVTIRDRESTSQKRVRVDELGGVLRKLISGNLSFDEL